MCTQTYFRHENYIFSFSTVFCFKTALQTIKNSLSQLISLTPEQLDNLNGYGCWCSLNHNWMIMNGQPQNQLDRLCKNLLKGYKCARKDYRKYYCDPYLVEYTPFDFSQPTSSINKFCESENGSDNCAQAVCL